MLNTEAIVVPVLRVSDHKKSKEEQQVRRELDTLLNTLLPIFKIYIIFLKSRSLRVLDYVQCCGKIS